MPAAPSRIGGAARALTGTLALGYLAMALALVGVQFWATSRGQDGPGVTAVWFQVAAGFIAVVLQAVADRRRDRTGSLCALGAFCVVLGSLWFWWWV